MYAATPDANQTVLGGFSFQGKPSRNVTANTMAELNAEWKTNDTFTVKGGLQWREANFKATTSGVMNPIMTTTQNLPAGVTIADITTQISGLDDLFGAGAPQVGLRLTRALGAIRSTIPTSSSSATSNAARTAPSSWKR